MSRRSGKRLEVQARSQPRDRMRFIGLGGEARQGRDHVEFATRHWVDWFNNRRLLGPIGNIPPVEFEALIGELFEDLAE